MAKKQFYNTPVEVNKKIDTSTMIKLSTYLVGNNINKMKEYIDNGGEINFEIAGVSLLTHAARCGKTEMVQLLINNGAEVNYINSNNSHILIEAAIPNNIDVMELLIDNGADVNFKINEISLLSHIIKNNNTELVVKFLLEKGAKLDEFTEVCNRLEQMILLPTENISPTHYDIIIKSPNIIAIQQSYQESNYTNIVEFINSEEFKTLCKNNTLQEPTEHEKKAIEFYEAKPEYQQSGNYLSDWLQREDTPTNLAYIMQNNEEVKKLVQQLAKISKLNNLNLDKNIGNGLEKALNFYNTDPKFDFNEEDGSNSEELHSSITSTGVYYQQPDLLGNDDNTHSDS